MFSRTVFFDALAPESPVEMPSSPSTERTGGQRLMRMERMLFTTNVERITKPPMRLFPDLTEGQTAIQSSGIQHTAC